MTLTFKTDEICLSEILSSFKPKFGQKLKIEKHHHLTIVVSKLNLLPKRFQITNGNTFSFFDISSTISILETQNDVKIYLNRKRSQRGNPIIEIFDDDNTLFFDVELDIKDTQSYFKIF